MKIYESYTCLKDYTSGYGVPYFIKGKSYKVLLNNTFLHRDEICFIDETKHQHYWDKSCLKKYGFIPTKVYNTKLGRLIYNDVS